MHDNIFGLATDILMATSSLGITQDPEEGGNKRGKGTGGRRKEEEGRRKEEGGRRKEEGKRKEEF